MKSMTIIRFASFLLLLTAVLFFNSCEKENFDSAPLQEAQLEQTVPAPDKTLEQDIQPLNLPSDEEGGAEMRSSRVLIYSATHTVAAGQWYPYWYHRDQLPDPNSYKLEIVVTPISGNPYLGVYGYLGTRSEQFREIGKSNTNGVEKAELRKSQLWSSETHAYIGVFGHGHVQARYRIEIYKVACCAPEDCVSFNPHNVSVKPYGSLWLVVDGNHSMFAAPNKPEADRIAQIIRYYGLNSSCFVGRPDPSFQYMLRNGVSPVGAMPGEDCIGFNPNNLQVVKIGGRWKIVEGNHWIFDFDTKLDEALQTLCLIREHGFTKTCYVGRPNPSLQYMRK